MMKMMKIMKMTTRINNLFSVMSIVSLFLGMYFHEGFSELENTYVNEKCGVSIQYPKDWVATESDYVFEDKSKTITDFQSEDDDILELSLAIEKLGLAKKSMAGISEWYKEYGVSSVESGIVSSGIIEINGFPTFEIIYYDGLAGEYEFQDEKFHTMEVLIIAYDREYRLIYEAANKADFDKYSSLVDEMANSIKITKPNFEGIKC